MIAFNFVTHTDRASLKALVDLLCNALEDVASGRKKGDLESIQLVLVAIGAPAVVRLCVELKHASKIAAGWNVQAATAKMLGQIKDGRAVAPLCDAFRDDLARKVRKGPV